MKPRIALDRATGEYVCWVPVNGVRYYIMTGRGATPRAAYYDWYARIDRGTLPYVFIKAGRSTLGAKQHVRTGLH